KDGTIMLCVMHDPNMSFRFGDQSYLMKDNRHLDTHGLDREQVRKLLKQTYQLPLISLENQKKWMFVPMLSGAAAFEPIEGAEHSPATVTELNTP
ncbi:MAG TPA: hypothetical protein DCP78_02920, partial [Sphingobacterium sp.]|nr:hypothetical protein [Sphingobacterium sp.]